MPDCAVVVGDVCCYQCHHILSDRILFQWGEVPAFYSIGDEVRWVKRHLDIMMPFKLYKGFSSWNCGDPTIENLLAFDGDFFDITIGETRLCPNCAASVAGAAVAIVANRLSRTITYSRTSLAHLFEGNIGLADIIVMTSDGNYITRPDWFDPPVEYVDEE